MMLHRHYDAIGRENAEKNGGVTDEAKDVTVSENESASETTKRGRKRKAEE